MAVLDFASKTVQFRFAIAGAPGVGKAEVLSQIHASLPPVRRDDIFVRAIGADQMAGFDLSPPCLIPVSDFVGQARIATMIGAVADLSNWNLVFGEIDALLFVVNDSRACLQRNSAALIALDSVATINAVPVVFYFRKSELPDALSFEALNAEFNPSGTSVVTTPEAVLRALLGAALAASEL